MDDKNLIESINQLQEEITYVVKNIHLLTTEMKEIKVELQAMRRNTIYLKSIAEILQNGIAIKK